MNLPELELKILTWWEENNIFKKSVEKPSSQGDFVFYEGPPTANGKPGIHHVLSRSFKDIIPRFKTMRGYRVVRKGGWDTHGLPVELEVEKQLGIKSKKEVEDYGIGPFNQKCRESVWKYKEEWEKFTMRMGFWLDLPNAYITYEGSYVNALWGVIKKIWERGLLIEGHKVVPHCPRCGTALSSHELAQGYQTVKETSVTVKFKLKAESLKFKVEGDVYILSWTTTPWTLPGNVALAVGKEIEYVIIRAEGRGEEYLILAKERLSILESAYEIVDELKGNELVGLEYEPLFDIPALKSPAAYKVYAADFVSTTDGTGVVHTAVMYGEDDYRLGAEAGLPKHHTVDTDGTFNASTPELIRGKFVKDPKTEEVIISDLETRGLLFNKELYEHEYPFCWRCKTPLLYYAKHSWFVAMSKLRQGLLDANNQINWVPDYIKEGRFGEWLREVKDWAFSRERYWGTPLPVWRCQSDESKVESRKSKVSGGCGKMEVIGSVAELVQKAKLKNSYIFMRHGEAESNIKHVCSSLLEKSINYPLTEKGAVQAKQAFERIKGEEVDYVFASDFHRTRQTAEIVAGGLGVTIEFDHRLREIHVGEFEGKSVDEAAAYFSSVEERFTKSFPAGEHYGDVLQRIGETVKEYEAHFEGKTVLIVSHGDVLWVLQWVLAGNPGKLADFPYPQFAQPIIVDRGVFLTNERGELDLHRPRVDEVEFPCECGGVMRRVPEVADVWFDSGAMPFAQYPENTEALTKEQVELKQFPADYISEAIDQTRGWFYTLLAVSVALGRGAPYRNVICLGHVMDAKGKKMSKSLGNIVVPGEMFEKYGADAVRWYLYTINDPGLPKRFDERELNEAVKKFFMIVWNVVSFHELYPYEEVGPLRRAYGEHKMDSWILSKLSQLTVQVTQHLEEYNITPAARAIQEFVTELSTWYVRRSRERMKTDEGEARLVLRRVLVDLSKLVAPFVPFTAEALWQRLGQKDSVHLAVWPEEGINDSGVTNDMEIVRKIVEGGLAARAAAKMPIRQPLAKATVKGKEPRFNDEYVEILKDELNVKEIVFVVSEGPMSVELDTNLTEELKLEGMKRELIRAVNNLRKEAKLTIKDRVVLQMRRDEISEKLAGQFKEEIIRSALLSDLQVVGILSVGKSAEVTLGGVAVQFGF